ncbi:outer membrane lipoprotein LolB [Panacagrimonas perspica]|uniref:Outer-membrane lipoprotein LolB n=1 Tax=Panacagrimonas perspica TaxID=381431 RepID=A0A4R7NTL9_9GAMM|nr:lipoprotein insertase outer membrane protein LolB [Panacagrimonas perspica]TDU24317.1 outer membrane lipoprotein LolB [Panacagrimonas perspica]THD04714.1 outer membrane lipoprotein LolB [Panacagrimonas perspica]
MRLILIAALIAALSGCALLRPKTEGTPADVAQSAAWQQRIALLSPIDRFVLQGRVASGALGFKADLRWKQHPAGRFEMRVAGPFGARAAELAGDTQEVRVRTGDDATTVTTDPEAWLEKALGVRLPVSGLRWWALGLPAPESHSDVLIDPASGRALRIVQNGWELDYVEYRVADSLDLPRRIEARNGDTRVLVLADQWSQLPPLMNPAP